MKSKSIVLLTGALAIATATALVARALMRPPPPVTIVKEVPAARPIVFRVLSAQRDLLPGEFINGSVLAWKDVPESDLRANHLSVRSDGDGLAVERGVYGATPRRVLHAGEVLTRDALVRAGEPGFISAVLAPGMRAVSIPTSAVASNAGLVSAGDWVDVILSLERGTQLSTASSSPLASLAAQTILRRVRVLALNNSVESIAPVVPPEELERDGKAKAVRTTPGRQVYETLTLEVTPEAAERLAVAREVGTLQVALRGTKEDLPGQDGSATAQAGTASGVRRVTRLADATEIFQGAGRSGSSVTVKTYQGTQQGAISF